MYDDERQQQQETYYTVITDMMHIDWIGQKWVRVILGYTFQPSLSSLSVSQCLLSLTLHPLESSCVSL